MFFSNITVSGGRRYECSKSKIWDNPKRTFVKWTKPVYRVAALFIPKRSVFLVKTKRLEVKVNFNIVTIIILCIFCFANTKTLLRKNEATLYLRFKRHYVKIFSDIRHEKLST